MTRIPGEPIIEFRDVEKALGESAPLRIARFTLRENERVVLRGLPGVMGEAFMNLIIGALLPDQGDVIVFGKNTKEIRTDTEWLKSLDRFGLVSDRAVLLDQSTLAQNLALPMTLAIDPIPGDVRAAVETLAAEAGLPAGSLDQPLGQAIGESGALRTQIHLARALAHNPSVLLLEHPTMKHGVYGHEFGARLRTIAGTRNLSVMAVSDDDRFARESGAERYLVDRDGAIQRAGFALRNFFPWRFGGS
jgi:ABC-type transporter Mla maintaining outer membrane lipid asymmetry ATPase subunit MlaF